MTDSPEEQIKHIVKLALVDAIPPEFSDEAIALKFTDMHGDKLRHVAAWGKWLLWSGTCWEFDQTMRAFDFSRAICRVVSSDAPQKSAPAIASAKTVAAVVSLSRADRRHAATVEQWDSYPWLLNTPDGVVDLKTGNMSTHDRHLYLTKMTAAAPGGDCLLFRKFLAEITDNNVDLQNFLQRVAGYSLTGITSEHALFFCYGTGGNGKGVFLNTLAGIMGDYAAVAPMETFVATQTDRHPTDLAGLRGARLVTSQETEQGRRWAESKIKTLTGGDPIPARFMRQDFFTYVPQFKLVIAGNHKPGLRGVDEAIRRRFNLLPFVVNFANPDKELSNKLRAEWPGILQWAIDGCLEWQRIGLMPPEIVQAATASYLAQEDLIEQWLEERCGRDKIYQERSSELFNDWKSWGEAAGEYVGSQKRFAQALEDRGFVRGRNSENKAIFIGVALRWPL
jgi:putative DNA primase/helicase